MAGEQLRLCPKCDEMKVPRPGGRVCKECRAAYRLAWYHKNNDEQKAYAKQQYHKHKHKWVVTRRRWDEAHPSKRVEYVIKHRQKHPEWWRAYRAMYSASKRGHVKRATPAWANKFVMDEAYRLAALRTKVTGYQWNVDHIVPLNGANVCGLHVHNNLCIIPAVENRKKYNKFVDRERDSIASAKEVS